MSCRHPERFRAMAEDGQSYRCERCAKEVSIRRVCHHPARFRAPLPKRRLGFHCARCDRDILPLKARKIRHGTPQGYEKHRRQRKGAWGWPACDPCMTGHREYQNEYNHQEEPWRARRDRSIARQRAYGRLAELHRRDFAKFYAEELSILRDGEASILPGLRAELARMLRGVNAEQLRRDIAMRWATTAEHELWGSISVLQGKIAEVERRASAREPGGDR